MDYNTIQTYLARIGARPSESLANGSPEFQRYSRSPVEFILSANVLEARVRSDILRITTVSLGDGLTAELLLGQRLIDWGKEMRGKHKELAGPLRKFNLKVNDVALIALQDFLVRCEASPNLLDNLEQRMTAIA